MLHLRKTTLLALSILLLPFSSKVMAQRDLLKDDPLPVPFALQWGQGPEDPVEWARKNGLVMRWIEVPGKSETTLEIEKGGDGKLPGVEFNKIRFNFNTGKLVEATVIYQREGNLAGIQSLQNQIQQELAKKWGKGDQSAEAVKNGDVSQTITWKVGEGRYILLNTTQAPQDGARQILWVGKVVYRHHALSLLIDAQER